MLSKRDCEILLEIDGVTYTTKIIRKINITHHNCLKHLNYLESEGLVKKKEKGRKKPVTLTRSGQMVQELLLNIRHILFNNNK